MKGSHKISFKHQKQCTLCSAAETVNAEEFFVEARNHVFLDIQNGKFLWYNFTKKYSQKNWECIVLKFATFEIQHHTTMKKFLIPMMIVAIIIAFYEETKAQKNIYIICIAIAVFMFGMMRLSAKTPSKNSEKDEDDV